MQRFKRKRTLNEIKAECQRRGWRLKRLDAGTSDQVHIEFKIGRSTGNAVVCTVSGRIYGEFPVGRAFSDDAAIFGNRKWFQELMACCYTHEELPSAYIPPFWVVPFKFSLGNLPLRKGCITLSNPQTNQTQQRFTIEMQLSGQTQFLPILLPTNEWFFNTAAERDQIFNALQ